MLRLQAAWIIGLGLNPGLHCLVGKDSTNWTTSPAHSFLFMRSVLWDRRTLGRILPLPAFVVHREGEKSWNLVLGAVLTHRVLLLSILRKVMGSRKDFEGGAGSRGKPCMIALGPTCHLPFPRFLFLCGSCFTTSQPDWLQLDKLLNHQVLFLLGVEDGDHPSSCEPLCKENEKINEQFTKQWL